jgi:hypothetical protein
MVILGVVREDLQGPWRIMRIGDVQGEGLRCDSVNQVEHVRMSQEDVQVIAR